VASSEAMEVSPLLPSSVGTAVGNISVVETGCCNPVPDDTNDSERLSANCATVDDRELELPKSEASLVVGKGGFVGITFEAPFPKIFPMPFITPSIWSDGVGVADALLGVEIAGGSLSLGTNLPPRPLRLSLDSLGKSED